jgi:hypothetical protein
MPLMYISRDTLETFIKHYALKPFTYIHYNEKATQIENIESLYTTVKCLQICTIDPDNEEQPIRVSCRSFESIQHQIQSKPGLQKSTNSANEATPFQFAQDKEKNQLLLQR